jgi:citrate lyase subunit beta/citryl-CoA lyase
MRSWLFVPGDKAKMIDKARGSAADAVILDLEDSVSPPQKAVARDVTRAALDAPRNGCQLWVRISALDSVDNALDIAAIIAGAPDGVVLPKATGAESISALASIIVAAGHDCPPILAIATETAASLFSIGTYREAGGDLIGLSWGAEDLSANLGSTASRDVAGQLTGPFALARNLCLFGAVAAKVQPVDTVFTDIRDLDGLEAECLAARRDGFTGKLAIHPAQIPVINRCFTPSVEDVAQARRIIAAFVEHPEAGAIALDGQMVDVPHLKRAERILARALSLEEKNV